MRHSEKRTGWAAGFRHTATAFADAICCALATDAPWRDLPPEFGPWESVYTRFRAYIKDGIFDEIL